jgi:hypothetical protein
MTNDNVLGYQKIEKIRNAMVKCGEVMTNGPPPMLTKQQGAVEKSPTTIRIWNII